jgi:hypothetical protein
VLTISRPAKSKEIIGFIIISDSQVRFSKVQSISHTSGSGQAYGEETEAHGHIATPMRSAT